MGISRDSRHKRRSTGGRKANLKKKRLYESGRRVLLFPAMLAMLAMGLFVSSSNFIRASSSSAQKLSLCNFDGTVFFGLIPSFLFSILSDRRP